MLKLRKIISLFCVMATLVLCATACSDTVVEEQTTEAEAEIIETVSETESEVETTEAETTTEVETTTVAETTTKAVTTTVATTEATTKAPVKETTTKAPTSASGTFSAADIGCTIKGVYIKPDTKWSNYSSALGKAVNEVQAPSCHFDGMDTIYEYNGFSIYTYLNNNVAYVYDIEITSSSIATPKGIKVGSSTEDVLAAYGNGYAFMNDYTIEYSQGTKSIYFTLNNGKVSMIEFFSD